MSELDRIFEDRCRGQDYCYPTAVEVLEKMGIVGVSHTTRT